MREKVVRKRDRLRSLEVRVAGHDGLDLVTRLVEQRARQIDDGRVELVEPIDREEPQVEGDLIVAAAGGVQLAGDITDELRQTQLDRGVNVFDVVRPWKSPPLDLGGDPL